MKNDYRRKVYPLCNWSLCGIVVFRETGVTVFTVVIKILSHALRIWHACKINTRMLHVRGKDGGCKSD